MKRDLINLTDLSSEELVDIIVEATRMKKNPQMYASLMHGKTLLMIFEKPSLRTRVSFETGMTKMGGHAIYYDVKNSPMGVGETIQDTSRCASRYVDIMMARLLRQEDTIALAKNSKVPVIDALSEMAHPCQIVADLMTILEKKGTLKGLKLVYLGDGENNVTYSLLHGCALVGINMTVSCPSDIGYMPSQKIIGEAIEIGKRTGSQILINNNPADASKDADIIVTDTWMSYHITPEKKEERVKTFMPYQVNRSLMAKAKKDAIFMHCLPVKRGYEATDEIIDGPQSVVFDEAENRMWTEMSIMKFLLEKSR